MAQVGYYWLGTDGNVWTQGGDGVNSAGQWDANTENYWNNQGFMRISDPVSGTYNVATPEQTPLAPISSNTTNRSGTSSYDPTELALLDSQIGLTNESLGQLGGQQQTGITNLLNSYNRGIGQIGTDRNQARSNYEGEKLKSEQGYLDSRSGIRRDAGNLTNSVRRLLGAAGSGRSSALSTLAPFAIGKEAGSRFGQVQNAFGENQGRLQTSWTQTENDLNDAERRLGEDRVNKENELKSGFAQQEMSLRDKLLQLQLQRSQLTGGGVSSIMPYLQESEGQIRTLRDRINSLSANYSDPQLNVARTAYSRPDLQQYNYSRFQAPTLQGRSAITDYTGPLTVQSLLEREKEEER